MAENSSSQEKTEEATPYRRQEARKAGTVARSVELTHAAVMLSLLLALPWLLTTTRSGFDQAVTNCLVHLPKDISAGSRHRYMVMAVTPVLGGFIGFLAVVMVMGVGSNVAQVGLVFSNKALSFNFDKLNPATGFKRLVSPNQIFEALKATLKCIVFALIAYSIITHSWGGLLSFGRLSPQQSVNIMIGFVQGMATQIVLVWLALAAIDYFFQKQRVDKELRMTKEEVKQEMKNNQQSAELRGAIARQRRRLSKNRVAQAMKKADVVITNPTHYAVAIEYDSQKSVAPIVVAKGTDLLAARIRELAEENKVPIVPNPPLARALHKQCEVGDPIPRDLFQPVAEVLAYVYKTLKRVKKG